MATALKMVHEKDPKQALIEKTKGLIDGIKMQGNRVLVAIYIRPEKTAGGLFLPDKTRDEERYQGKAGLILAAGPTAFNDDKWWPVGQKPQVGDWVLFNIGDTRRFIVGDTDCRWLEDSFVSAVIPQPDMVY